MTTEDATTHGRTRSLSPLTVAGAGIALVCIAAVAALVRWSQWWPHSDMRQVWANGLTVLSGVVGLITLSVAFRRLDGRHRWLLAGFAVLAAAVGLLGGFELLRGATADLR